MPAVEIRQGVWKGLVKAAEKRRRPINPSGTSSVPARMALVSVSGADGDRRNALFFAGRPSLSRAAPGRSVGWVR